MHWCSGIYHKFSFLRICVRDGAGMKVAFFLSLVLQDTSGRYSHISAAAWLLHILSPPETCPQLLERMDFAHEVWWLSYQAIDPSFSRILMWRSAFSENFTSRVSGIGPFRKIELGLGGPAPWITPNWREFFNQATALLSPFFLGFVVGLPFDLLLLEKTLFDESATQWFLAILIFGGCQKSHDGFVHLPLRMSRHGFL